MVKFKIAPHTEGIDRGISFIVSHEGVDQMFIADATDIETLDVISDKIGKYLTQLMAKPKNKDMEDWHKEWHAKKG